ncbi:MAG: alpha amylase N-terminal ig-like domain-containing protein [Niameybacter sp.]
MNTWKESVFSDGTKLFVNPINGNIGEALTIRMRVFKESPVQKVYIKYLENGEEVIKEMQKDHVVGTFQYYTYTFNLYQKKLIYCFILITDEEVWFYTQKGLQSALPLGHYDFQYLFNFKPMEWLKKAVCYQIFPERFKNGNSSNDVKEGEYTYQGFKARRQVWKAVPKGYKDCGNLEFFGGDLDGILEKLPYLKKLGVNCIYLNPIFTAYSSHKYDCVDYFHVDPHFGGDEALEQLCEAIHEAGMHILLDISINHTGINHPWTVEHPEYYYHEPDGHLCLWQGVEDLVTLNYEHPQVREIIYKGTESVIQKWLNPPYNIDGWRFDVGQSVGKMYDSEVDESVWREIHEMMKLKYPDRYILAEHWGECTKYLQGDMWDASMNYGGFYRPLRKYLGLADPIMSWKISDVLMGKKSSKTFMEETTNYASCIPAQLQQLQFNLIGSHDINRLSTEPCLSQSANLAAILMLFTYIGVPNVYYGEEIGLEGRTLPADIGARYPMKWEVSQWDLEKYALYSQMIALRNEEVLLQTGSFKFIQVDEETLAYVRFDEKSAILFIHAYAQKPRQVEIDLDSVGEVVKVKSIYQVESCAYNVKQGKLYIQLLKENAALFHIIFQ